MTISRESLPWHGSGKKINTKLSKKDMEKKIGGKVVHSM